MPSIKQSIVVSYLQSKNSHTIYLTDLTQYISLIEHTKRAHLLGDFFSRPWTQLLPHLNNPPIDSPLLGFLACFLSPETYPKYDHTAYSFISASANGKFCIYPLKSTNNHGVFLKVSLPNADFFEAETVIMQTLQRATKQHPKIAQHLMNFLASSLSLTTPSSPNQPHGALDFDNLFHNTYTGYYGSIPDFTPDAYPSLMSTAVSPGYSFGDLMRNVAIAMNFEQEKQYLTPQKRDKILTDMRLFFRSALFDRIFDAPSPITFIKQHLPKIATMIAERLPYKLAVLFSALIKLADTTDVRFTHGDLHAYNVLYDMVTDQFVAIDYGRSFVNMDPYFTQLEIDSIHYRIRSNIRQLPPGIPTTSLTERFFYQCPNDYMMKVPTNTTSFLDTHGVLFDIAGLSFITAKTLKAAFRPFASTLNPFKPYETFIRISDDETELWIAHTPGLILKAFKANPKDALMPGLVWFALFVLTMIRQAEAQSNPIHTDMTGTFYVCDIDDIIGQQAPFYVAGQLMPWALASHKRTFEMMLGIMNPVEKRTHLEMFRENLNAFTKHFYMTKPDNNSTGGGKMPTKKTTMTKKKPYPFEYLQDNYEEHREQAARHSIVNSQYPIFGHKSQHLDDSSDIKVTF